jgi:glutaredoxin
MKPYIAILGLLCATLFSFKALSIFYWEINAPTAVTLAANSRVVLYSTEWCGYCKQAQLWLDANSIGYRKCDIETNSECASQHDAIGIKGVPVLLINGKARPGFDRAWVWARLRW